MNCRILDKLLPACDVYRNRAVSLLSVRPRLFGLCLHFRILITIFFFMSRSWPYVLEAKENNNYVYKQMNKIVRSALTSDWICVKHMFADSTWCYMAVSNKRVKIFKFFSRHRIKTYDFAFDWIRSVNYESNFQYGNKTGINTYIHVHPHKFNVRTSDESSIHCACIMCCLWAMAISSVWLCVCVCVIWFLISNEWIWRQCVWVERTSSRVRWFAVFLWHNYKGK